MTEICVIVYAYIGGKNGLLSLEVQRKELRRLQFLSEQLQKEIDEIEGEISEWEAGDFYKEKVAREQLQLARKGDKLFYIE
jgi:cell division protein FtsB